MAKASWLKTSTGWIQAKKVWVKTDAGWIPNIIPKVKEYDGIWYECMEGASTTLTLGISAMDGYTFDYYATGVESLGYDIYGEKIYEIYNGNTVTVKIQITSAPDGENIHGQLGIPVYSYIADTYQLYSWLSYTWSGNILDGDIYCDGFVDNSTEF